MSDLIRNRTGAVSEHKLLKYLERKYPHIEFRWIENGKSTFDIYSKYALFDMVSVDSSLRLITDHKKELAEHIREAKNLGIPGYIAFEFLGCFYFLKISSKVFKKQKRVHLTSYVLRSCVRPDLPEQLDLFLAAPWPMPACPEETPKPKGDNVQIESRIGVEEWNKHAAKLKEERDKDEGDDSAMNPFYEDGILKNFVEFRWEEVPGADAERFLKTLSLVPGKEWLQNASIEKQGDRLKLSDGRHIVFVRNNPKNGLFLPKIENMGKNMSKPAFYPFWVNTVKKQA